MACCSDRASCSCWRDSAELAASRVEAVADDGDDERMEGMETKEEGVEVAGGRLLAEEEAAAAAEEESAEEEYSDEDDDEEGLLDLLLLLLLVCEG